MVCQNELRINLIEWCIENINSTYFCGCDTDGNVIKKKKIKSNSKNIEISKKYTQVKQELLLVIKMGLKLKLGYKSVESLSAISKIDSLKLLE
ncbi:MAG: hypothetical protein O4806_11820 [Trichodesmium sp. St5_bin8]|mgnify:CR=1 FL=1|nr:hypothetical protein [Trichodesmium sp. St5_bin8]